MKSDRSVKKVTASLDVLRFPKPSEDSGDVNCLNCSWPLVMSQPDVDSPERLLGVCGHCRHWFLVDLISDQDEGIISKLPDLAIIRDLCRENPDEGISVMSDFPGKKPARSKRPKSKP